MAVRAAAGDDATGGSGQVRPAETLDRRRGMATTIRQGDREPSLTSTLREDTGVPVDLTDATVWLHLYDTTTRDERLYAEARVVGEGDGTVLYEWQPSDTDRVGEFNAAWEVVYPDGRRLVFDDPDPPTVEVVDDLDIED
jgi:hypothetical protein